MLSLGVFPPSAYPLVSAQCPLSGHNMPAINPEEVELRARVPRELYDRWHAKYPFFGVTTWMFVQVLTEMVDDDQPDAVEVVRDKVRKMLSDNKQPT